MMDDAATRGAAAEFLALLEVVREDYVAHEIVQYDGWGRPIMSVITERPDGSNDIAVLAPTAVMRVAM